MGRDGADPTFVPLFPFKTGCALMPFITLTDLQKSFGKTRVVKDFSLTLEKGEFVSLLGPSGCGKTTVLRMVAGFETEDQGQIAIDGQSMAGLGPRQRKIGMVFQSYALFPNLTVAENVAFGLRVAGVARDETSRRVDEMLEMVGLSGFAARYPWQLSGGQQQRVALARAIAPRPRVLLLDEPLSALDAKIRVTLRSEIRTIQRALGITTLFVTHDQEEALGMSDRVVVMHDGRAEQIGTPAAVYDTPATRFVAGFIGTLNLVEAQVADASTGRLTSALGPVSLDRVIPASDGQSVTLAIRPQAMDLHATSAALPSGHIALPAILQNVEFLGSILRMQVQIGPQTLLVDRFNRDTTNLPALGQMLNLSVAAKDVVLLNA
jgi:putative spermidine/putrescine transport system ATP-binding protein